MGSITCPSPTWAVSKFHQDSSFKPSDTAGLVSEPLPKLHFSQTRPLRLVALPIRPVERGGERVGLGIEAAVPPVVPQNILRVRWVATNIAGVAVDSAMTDGEAVEPLGIVRRRPKDDVVDSSRLPEGGRGGGRGARFQRRRRLVDPSARDGVMSYRCSGEEVVGKELHDGMEGAVNPKDVSENIIIILREYYTES